MKVKKDLSRFTPWIESRSEVRAIGREDAERFVAVRGHIRGPRKIRVVEVPRGMPQTHPLHE